MAQIWWENHLQIVGFIVLYESCMQAHREGNFKHIGNSVCKG